MAFWGEGWGGGGGGGAGAGHSEYSIYIKNAKRKIELEESYSSLETTNSDG